MIRILRLEFALAALLLAPLVGYAIAWLLTGDAGRPMRAMPVVPAREMGSTVLPPLEMLPAGGRGSVPSMPVGERRA